MKDIEKIFKDSFNGFEPEVNNSVWQQLEQNLSSPVSADPSSSVSAGKIAAIAVKSSTWIWVAAIVSTAVIATAVILSQENASPDKSPVVQPQTSIMQNQNKEESNAEIENTAAQQGSKAFAAPERKTEKNIKAEKNSNINSANRNTPSNANPAEHGLLPVSTPVTHGEKIAGDNSTRGSAEAPAQQSTGQNLVASEPAVEKAEAKPVTETNIIIKNTIGFAPFKITALLNDESLKGSWDFGDGNGALENRISHTYTTPGNYTLVCTVNGKEIKRTIEVVGTISTAFTPNGDGWNDEYYLDIPSLEEVRMTIFDRNGRKVYEITSPDQRWDGKKVNGEPLPAGTYFYDIFARSNGQAITQKGSINIFR